MKVIYAPLVSSASGRFGGLVASSWKGISLVRRFAPPANPNTSAQQEVRMIFATLTKAYVTMTAQLRAAWEGFASGKAFIGRNHWIGLNVALLEDEVALTDLAGTPGDASTLGAVSMTVTPGANQLTVAITEPALPTGWTIAKAVAVCVLDGDWSTLTSYADLKWTETEDATSPYECVLAGLTASVLYAVRAFLVWTDPNGDTRYSVSLADTGTPTA